MSILVARGPVYAGNSNLPSSARSLVMDDWTYARISYAVTIQFCPDGWNEAKVGSITTSKAMNKHDEKDCYHEKLDGLLTIMPEGSSKNIESSNEGNRDWQRVGCDPCNWEQFLFPDWANARPVLSTWVIHIDSLLRPFKKVYKWQVTNYRDASGRQVKEELEITAIQSFIVRAGETWSRPYLEVCVTEKGRRGDNAPWKREWEPMIFFNPVLQPDKFRVRLWRTNREDFKKYGEGKSITVWNHYLYQLTSRGLPSMTVEHFNRAISSAACKLFELVRHKMHPLVFPMHEHIPKMLKYALDDLRWFTFNMNLYIRDLFRLKQAVLPLVKLLKKPLSPKNWANAWLTYRYGIRLTLLDSMRLAEGYSRAEKLGFQLLNRVRARGSYKDESTGFGFSFNMKLWFEPFDDFLSLTVGRRSALKKARVFSLSEVIRYLRVVDLIPSAYNIWDYLPYSFVVDWFIPVSDWLYQIDADSDLALFRAESMVLTCKAARELNDQWFKLALEEYYPGAGETQFIKSIDVRFSGRISVYNRCIFDMQNTKRSREITTRLPTADLFGGLSVKTGIDSLALITQRMRNPLRKASYHNANNI